MDYLQYIKPELLVLIPVLSAVGYALKHSSILFDKHIPLALGLVGVALAGLYVLSTSILGSYQDVMQAVFVAVVQGVLCSGAAVYGHQIIKQGGKEDE